MKYNMVYKTINIKNNKEYIGVHSSNTEQDNYLGSGKTLVKAIKKYGRENFKRVTLFLFDTKEECYEKEKELVNEEYIERDDTYNIKPGGYGSLNYKWTEDQKNIKKIQNKGKNNPNFGNGNKIKGKNNGRHKDNFNGDILKVGENISTSLKKYYKDNNIWNKGAKMPEGHSSKEPKELVKCPYCGKEGGKPSMKRWHFDNCKLKKV